MLILPQAWVLLQWSSFLHFPSVSHSLVYQLILKLTVLVRQSGLILLESAPNKLDPADVKHDLEKVGFLNSCCMAVTLCFDRFLASYPSMSCISGVSTNIRLLHQFMSLCWITRFPNSLKYHVHCRSVSMPGGCIQLPLCRKSQLPCLLGP